MSEFYDNLINDAVSDFNTASATSPIRVPGGAAMVRATARRRRATRFATLCVLGAVLLASPIAALGVYGDGHKGRPIVGDSPEPTPVESVSPSAVDGRISLADLTAVEVDLPPVDTHGVCPQGRQKLESKPAQRWWVVKIVYTNLDDDAAQETAALLSCKVTETSVTQVVAFDREAGGKIRTLGQVAGNGYMLNVRDIDARAQGGVIADVTDIVACCDTPVSREQHQTREYAWDGTGFTQVAGPTAYGDAGYITDLQVTATNVTLGPVVDGKRSGTVTITVKNNGPLPSGRFQVGLGDCTFSCSGGMPFWAWGDHTTYHAPLEPGQSASATLHLSFPADTTGGSVTARLKVVDRSDDKAITSLNLANDVTVFQVKAG